MRGAAFQPPAAVPQDWAALPIGVGGRNRHQTWVVYDPSLHRLARVIGPRNTGLHRRLLDAGGRTVLARPDLTVYLLPLPR